MAEELKMWAIEGGGEVARVEGARHTETENLLEDALVRDPDMLIHDLKLVGRQIPTSRGSLDLLGVDPDGRLVVFELKRGELVREAVAQIIDYASDLDTMSDDQLATLIERSGRDGIDRIEDFKAWYDENFGELRLWPVKMMLVGLDADDRTTRMVDFLATQGMDISLLTFHGYKHEDKTFLARTVRATEAARKSRGQQEKKSRRAVDELAKEHGVSDIFGEAVERFRRSGRTLSTLTDGYTFNARSLELPEHKTKFNASLSLRIRKGKVLVTFFAVSVHLCEAKFQEAERSIPFERERPTHTWPTNDVSEQRYCILDRSEWNTHKETLFELADAVSAAWDEARQNQPSTGQNPA